MFGDAFGTARRAEGGGVYVDVVGGYSVRNQKTLLGF